MAGEEAGSDAAPVSSGEARRGSAASGRVERLTCLSESSDGRKVGSATSAGRDLAAARTGCGAHGDNTAASPAADAAGVPVASATGAAAGSGKVAAAGTASEAARDSTNSGEAKRIGRVAGSAARSGCRWGAAPGSGLSLVEGAARSGRSSATVTTATGSARAVTSGAGATTVGGRSVPVGGKAVPAVAG